ncbi:MAG: DUF6150 family protein [Acidobacteriota bacterium]|jgi:hypothetical protein
MMGKGKIFSALLFALAVTATAAAKNVYVTENPSEADVRVYVTLNRSEADLCVYMAHSQSEALGKEAIWYDMTDPSAADLFVVFVSNRSDAGLTVYFVRDPSEAGGRFAVFADKRGEREPAGSSQASICAETTRVPLSSSRRWERGAPGRNQCTSCSG